MHLSIIIPAYNEEHNLRSNIKKFINYLTKQIYDYEIIIINDGSIDNTAKVAREFSKEYEKISFIDNPVNQGKGAAVKQGLLMGKGDYRLFIDADGATSIEHIDKIWPKFEAGADIVIGTRNPRDAAGAYQKIKQASWKRFFGILGNCLIRALTVKEIHDTQCGFKAFTKETIEKIIPRLTINRWAFDVEILILAQVSDLKISKIPVVWENSTASRVGIKGYFITLKEIFKIKKNQMDGKYKHLLNPF